MQRTALTLIKFHDNVSAQYRVPLLEAAAWVEKMGFLPVAINVKFDGRMADACCGDYSAYHHRIRINPKQLRYGGGVQKIQGILVHELLHLYQDFKGYLNKEKYPVNTRGKNWDIYLKLEAEREAFWWQEQYMWETHGTHIIQRKEYLRLGCKEFE